MKVVGIRGVGERRNYVEMRLGVTRHNIEMRRAHQQRTGCQPIGERCSLHLGISSLRDRDRTSAHLLRAHGAPIKLTVVVDRFSLFRKSQIHNLLMENLLRQQFVLRIMWHHFCHMCIGARR